jgi:hypothetical protein
MQTDNQIRNKQSHAASANSRSYEMAKNVQNSHFSFARIFIFNGKYAVTKFTTSLSGYRLAEIFTEITQKIII